MKNVYKYTLKRERVLELREERANKPQDVVAFLQGIGLHEHEQEHFVVVFLDTKCNIKGYSLVSMGLVDRTHIHPREVFRNAILQGASRVLLAHNHPSGVTKPSKEDIKSTKMLVSAGKIIGIEVLDHIIIGEEYSGDVVYTSFREQDLL